jgi:hypothetical protein
MCLMVWIGTVQPVGGVARPAGESPDSSSFRTEVEPANARIRECFVSPCVTYVGSHQGCGCGFNSSMMHDREGISAAADAMPLLDALDDPAREDFLAEQGSRAWLRALVSRALADGDVEIYGCWAGDEGGEPVRVETVDVGWFTERVAPIEELVKYVVRASG